MKEILCALCIWRKMLVWTSGYFQWRIEQHLPEFVNFFWAISVPFNFPPRIFNSMVRLTKIQQFSDQQSFQEICLPEFLVEWKAPCVLPKKLHYKWRYLCFIVFVCLFMYSFVFCFFFWQGRTVFVWTGILCIFCQRAGRKQSSFTVQGNAILILL